MPGTANDPRRATQAGFSLLEVLAALVVTMLLVLALTPFVGQMLGTWTRGSETARLVEVMTRGAAVLQRDLRHAIAWTGARESDAAPQFRGDALSLSFPAATGLGLGQGDVEMISITVNARENGRALVRRSAPLTATSRGSFADPVVLFSGPFSYRFEYISRKGVAMPAWTDAHELPARVALAIIGERGPLFKAPLEFPIPASFSAACFVDNTRPGCPNTRQTEEDINRWLTDFGYTGDR